MRSVSSQRNVIRPPPHIGQLPDNSWVCFNMPESSPLYSQTFATRREAAAALIYERTREVMEKRD